MTRLERVKVIRDKYPGYDGPLDSKVRNPEWYGVTLVKAAQQLLDGKPKKDARYYKMTVRIPKSFVDMADFREKLCALGYSGFTQWALTCIKRQESEYAARQKGKSLSESHLR
jgi:hypothetical protein